MCACAQGGRQAHLLFQLRHWRECGRGRIPFGWEGRKQWTDLFGLLQGWFCTAGWTRRQWNGPSRCALTTGHRGGECLRLSRVKYGNEMHGKTPKMGYSATADARSSRYSRRGISIPPRLARWSVSHCVSNNNMPSSCMSSTKYNSATLDASVSV